MLFIWLLLVLILGFGMFILACVFKGYKAVSNAVEISKRNLCDECKRNNAKCAPYYVQYGKGIYSKNVISCNGYIPIGKVK